MSTFGLKHLLKKKISDIWVRKLKVSEILNHIILKKKLNYKNWRKSNFHKLINIKANQGKLFKYK